MKCHRWFSDDFFQFSYKNTHNFILLHYMAFGRIWQHAKYSYRVWQSFAYNSENFQKPFKIEKCEDLFQMFRFEPKQ